MGQFVSDFVSDEVWHRLRPVGARVSRRTVVRFWAAGGGALAVLFAATGAWASGSIRPWLREAGAGWAASVSVDDANGRLGPRPAEQMMILTVQNQGWQEVRIVEVGEDSSGIRMLGASATATATASGGPITRRSPHVLGPGETVEIALFLLFTDCRAVSELPWAVPIRLARQWGTQTTHVFHPPIRASSGHGGWSVTGRGDPGAVEWQRWIADDVCGVPYDRRAPGSR